MLVTFCNCRGLANVGSVKAYDRTSCQPSKKLQKCLLPMLPDHVRHSEGVEGFEKIRRAVSGAEAGESPQDFPPPPRQPLRYLAQLLRGAEDVDGPFDNGR